MFKYRINSERAHRNYLNFTVNAQTDDTPEKDMMAVPFVGEKSFEYVTIGKRQEKLDKIQFAYLPKADVRELQQNEVYSFEEHNWFLRKYKKRTLYCVNPKNYEFDIGLSIVSVPTSYQKYSIKFLTLTEITAFQNIQNTKKGNNVIEAKTEVGEFCNCSNKDSIVLSYWQKHEMESMKTINPSFFIYLSQLTYKSFQFQRDRALCLGINAYLGMFI